jgi:alpha-ketoglutarate-dependent taurine dioxygenase
MRSIDYGAIDSIAELRQALDDLGVAYVRGVGGDEHLLSLAESLGEVTEPGVAMPSQAHNGRIYSVHVRNRGEGVVDQHGNLIVSTTNLEFSLHTDAYNRLHPPRYVLLLRADNGLDDTPSFVSDMWITLDELSPSSASKIVQPVFPSALGPVALLHPTDGQRPTFRFNEQEIVRWAGRDNNPALGPGVEQAIADFNRCLQLHRETRTIQHADCLVLDNTRVCHGRPVMAPDSTRELKRVWVA